MPSSATDPRAAILRRSRARTIAIVSLIAATLFWSGTLIIGADAVAAMDPLSIVFWRWALATIPLVVLAQLIERPDWRQALRAWPWMLVLGLLGLAGYNVLLMASLMFTDPLSSALVNAFNPALITLAAAVFLRERLTRGSVIGVLLAFIGVLIVLTHGNLLAIVNTGFGTGELLMLIAITAFTAYVIIGRFMPEIPPITATAVQCATSTAAMLPVSVALGGPALPATGTAVAELLYLAFFPSVLSYLLWNRSVAVLPAGAAGVFLNLVTVFTAAFTILLGYPYTATQIIGGVIIIGGVVVTNVPAKKPSPQSDTG